VERLPSAKVAKPVDRKWQNRPQIQFRRIPYKAKNGRPQGYMVSNYNNTGTVPQVGLDPDGVDRERRADRSMADRSLWKSDSANVGELHFGGGLQSLHLIRRVG